MYRYTTYKVNFSTHSAACRELIRPSVIHSNGPAKERAGSTDLSVGNRPDSALFSQDLKGVLLSFDHRLCQDALVLEQSNRVIAREAPDGT